MGDVETTSKACIQIMLGLPIASETSLLPFLHGGIQGSRNQRYMAAAAGLGATLPMVRDAAELEADALLRDEEATGPGTWEIFAPDPHGGMYALAWVGVVAAGLAVGASATARALGARSAVVLGQMLRVGDLVATPDGDLRGLPGMRAPLGAAISRRSLSVAWVETRRRQPGGAGLAHRGTGGNPQPLQWTAASDPLVDGAACWLRMLLDGPGGQALLDSPLSLDAALPKLLRLPLVVYRGPGGTLAYFPDPGEAARAQFVVSGSAAANRSPDHRENPVSWVRVLWGTPGHHAVDAGMVWQTPPPPPPVGAGRFDIPGAVQAAPGAPVGVPPAAPTSAPTGGTLDPLFAEDFAARLSALGLSNREQGVRIAILHDLQAGIPLTLLAHLADRVAALGIGPGQPQYHSQQSLVADMRAAAR